MVLVLLQQRDRHETEAAGCCHEHRRLLAAPDQCAVGKLPGAFGRGREADTRLGRLPGP